MSEKQEIQAEDSPVEKTMEETLLHPTSAQPARKSFMDRALPWAIVALVFFIVGAIVTWLAVYSPKAAELTEANNDLATANTQITSLQDRITQLEKDVNETKESLSALQKSYDDQTLTLTSAQTLQLIYKLQADVNAARATLLNHDPASSRQALSFVSADLADLDNKDIDPAALSGFKNKVQDANTNLESDPQKSIDSLNALNANLLLLINNYK